MSRIKACFEALQQKARKALIPYIVAGDPDIESTLAQMHGMVDAGADIIELGVPFSDPMAEGPVIQLAHERALEHNTSLRDVLACVKKFRLTNNQTPVILMGYLNPVERFGYQAFALLASESGVDGLLTVDLPPEEAFELNEALAAQSIDSIFLIAPTTDEQRVAKICAGATGYLYYVSLKGVTGANKLNVEEVEQKLRMIRAHTKLPISVGFGIKDPESAKAVAQFADGVVVGSALVDYYAKRKAQPQWDANAAPELLIALRSAMDEV
ncbi:MAG: tryptophan synthase subunit alpha [Gammaproteobacteria bacterium]|nr:MAG: tryptophan synthase subunit alpha [Gammaproteobacteria bacterium]